VSAKACRLRTLVLDLNFRSSFAGWYFETKDRNLSSVCAADDPFAKALEIICVKEPGAPTVHSPGTPGYLKCSANWPDGLFLMNSDNGNDETLLPLYSGLTSDGCSALFSLIEELTVKMDICIIFTDCSEYNALTVACMNSSHYVLTAIRPDLFGIMEYFDITENSGFGAAAQRTKFIAWECDSGFFLNSKAEACLRDGDIAGIIRSSKKRTDFRYTKERRPYAAVMEKSVQSDYKGILGGLGLLDKMRPGRAAFS